LEDDQTRQLAAKTCFEVSPVLDEENPYTMDTVVRVQAKDGRDFTSRTRYATPRGQAGVHAGIRFSPVDDAGIENKFLNLAEPVIEGPAAARILEGMRGLAQAPSVLPLIEACSSPQLQRR
jgi:hypothetical protein